LLDLVDTGGVSLREAIVAFGGDPDGLAGSVLHPGSMRGYMEVHIEQGPYLESVDAPVGVVTAIAGQTRVLVSFTGEAGHAGTVAMNLRRDALPAAAELILAVEEAARTTTGMVATVGRVEVEPGAFNVVPGLVRLTLDIRHADDATRTDAVATLASRARAIAETRSLDVDWRIAQENPAVPCDIALTERLAEAVTAAEAPVERLPSGAGHDAVVVSALGPVAMLFVRCAGGISHNPAESVAAADVAVAIDVLDRFLDSLAAEARR
jgi:hydantoinase/carbamoylase family amidase